MRRRAAPPAVLFASLTAAVSGLALGGPASAAPVHAIVYFGRAAAGPDAGAAASAPAPGGERLGYVRLPNGVLPIAAPSLDARGEPLLLLEPEPAPTQPADAPADAPVAGAAAEAEQRLYGMRLLPSVLLLKPGARVILRNDDRQPVTLRCPEVPALLPGAAIEPGARITVTLPPSLPPRLSLTSPDYPHLRGLWLAPRGAAARLALGDQGAVGVAKLDLPAGRYRMTLLIGPSVAVERALEVPAKGTEFVVRLAQDAEGAATPAPRGTPTPPTPTGQKAPASSRRRP
ncbi:MAG: hypothetical protein U1A78_27435 [Polyangia bacterium]